MTTITQVREDQMKFDLIINDNMPEVFTDGLSQLLLGNSVSKLTLHSVITPIDPESGVEQRQGVMKLTIPTAVLLELCRNVLRSAQVSIDALCDREKQTDIQIRKIMESVNILIPPANDPK